MRVLWVSPRGDGAMIAERVRDAGHKLVVYGEGAGLPLVKQGDLYAFAKASDLIVVDSAFPVIRTRRSWRPHQDALFFDELRRQYDFTALGPTPTVDLLVGDKRYFRKWCQRLAIPYGQSEGDPWTSGGWFKSNEVIPDGPYLGVWKSLFKSIGFRGWFELYGTISDDGIAVAGARANWTPELIPVGKEADFLKEMAS